MNDPAAPMTWPDNLGEPPETRGRLEDGPLGRLPGVHRHSRDRAPSQAQPTQERPCDRDPSRMGCTTPQVNRTWWTNRSGHSLHRRQNRGSGPRPMCWNSEGHPGYHMDTQGLQDIAYNALVCEHGFVFAGRGPGIANGANGQTAANVDWPAVCYLGGDGDPLDRSRKGGDLGSRRMVRRSGQGMAPPPFVCFHVLSRRFRHDVAECRPPPS